MNKAKLIENIKSQLKSILQNEQKFAEVKAGDMVITSPDEQLVVGSEVFMVDTEGNNVPLSDGEYVLDSGVKIAVVGGKISGMVDKATEEEVAAQEEAPVAPEKEAEGEAPEAETEIEVESPEVEKPSEEDMVSMVKECMNRIVAMEQKIEEMTKSKAQMEQKLSAIANLPATKSIEVVPSEFKSVEEKKDGVGMVDIGAIRERARKNR